ncbi:MAG: EAL domain-containing protein [Lachnospiraceae bacterium]|nr:EAL domain-containing protein [Lachnospiraceae bacterium]
MWNYSYILPSFMVLLIFLNYYFSKPRLSIRINIVFLQLIVTELIVLFFDVSASLADEHYRSLPTYLVFALNLGYFVSYLARAYLFYCFTAALFGISNGKNSSFITNFPVFAASELITLSSVFTGAVFTVTEEGYKRGPLYEILYFCFAYYLASSIFILLKKRSQVSHKEFMGVGTFNIILVIGNIIRMLFPSYLVMNTFCLMAIIIIYLSFQNPEYYQAHNEGIFNNDAFERLLKEITDKKIYSILAFQIRNYNELREIYSRSQVKRITADIGNYLNSIKSPGEAFYLTNGAFALLFPKEQPLKPAHLKLSERFEGPWDLENGEVYLEISFVRILPGNLLNTAEKVLNGLSDALSRISDGGETEILVDAETLDRLEHLTEVKRALEYSVEEDLVEVFLQPLIDCSTGNTVGAEALARIRDAEGKLIPPGEFIPLAEKNGRIAALGEQVFEKVCAFIKEHDISKAGLAWINVNVSPLQCLRKDLSEHFLGILERYGVSAHKIHLELTEECLVDYKLLKEQVENMQKIGLRFALDDYGTGYSNLARLKHFPFINVKLDMSVVDDYYKEPDDILPTLVQTFKSMGFSVTAEGIENEEMAAAMKRIGCDFLQGYYFSKPLPMEEFVNKYPLLTATKSG